MDGQHASQTQQPGDPHHMRALLGSPPRDHQAFAGQSNDTSNCLVADQWGNVVAATPSGWGGVTAGASGVQLGSRMIGHRISRARTADAAVVLAIDPDSQLKTVAADRGKVAVAY